MNRLFDTGVIESIPKKVLANVLIDGRKLIGKGEDDWNTVDTCKVIELLLPEPYKLQLNGTDAVNFKNIMQRLRKDKVVPRIRSPRQMRDRFGKFIRDYKKNRDRKGNEHLSQKYIEYVLHQSEAWVAKAREHKKRCNYMCQLCGKTSKLEVHHTPEGYRNLTNEQPWHLIAVCADPCHVIADMLREGWFVDAKTGSGLLK